MKATTKKRIERNIRNLVAVGDKIPVFNKSTRQPQGTLVVTSVSREEIHGNVQVGETKWAGTPACFRVPQLTQKGGDNFLELAEATA